MKTVYKTNEGNVYTLGDVLQYIYHVIKTSNELVSMVCIPKKDIQVYVADTHETFTFEFYEETE